MPGTQGSGNRLGPLTNALDGAKKPSKPRRIRSAIRRAALSRAALASVSIEAMICLAQLVGRAREAAMPRNGLEHLQGIERRQSTHRLQSLRCRQPAVRALALEHARLGKRPSPTLRSRRS